EVCPSGGPAEEALRAARFAERVVATHVGGQPSLQALGFEHGPMQRIVEAHLRERLAEATSDSVVEPGPRGEHAMRIGWRRPHLTDAAGRRKRLLLHAAPERTADRARVRRAVEDGAQDVDLAGPRVAVLAEIRIEAHRTVVAALGEAELGEKVHRKDGGVTAVAAAECQDATAQIVDRTDRAT